MEPEAPKAQLVSGLTYTAGIARKLIRLLVSGVKRNWAGRAVAASKNIKRMFFKKLAIKKRHL
jgi:hypothetical protein